ncbi:MAG: alpha/beta hydrolase [Coriobacteriia bacterium]|nr:alpha/beta hydrolase [Coriobacteriia bacterium]
MLVGPIDVRKHGGSGPTVVLLHGGPGAQGSLASLAGTLAPHYSVLEPLQRRSGDVSLTVEQHVRDMAEVAPESATYVGWSWGAMLGLSFASLYPGLVKTLVLVGCGCYDEESRESHAIALRRRMDRQGQARHEDLQRRMKAATDRAWRDDLFGQIGALAEKAEAVEPLGFVSGDVQPDALGFEETWQDAARLQHECIEPARFTGIRCPVLMLHGDEDVHPGTRTRDVLQRHIPQLAYIGIPKCGHVPWYERHGRTPFLETLKEWIDDVG